MNRKSMLIAAFFVGLSLSSAGCATAGSVRDQPLSEGEARTFTGPFDRIVQVAREAVDEAELNVKEDRLVGERTWMILASNPMNATSWGEVVRVVLEDRGDGQVIVRLHSERRLAANVSAKDDWRADVFGVMAAKLRPCP